MSYWYELPNGIWWCRVPKNAQTSIKEHALNSKPLGRTDMSNTIAVVRHPCDRLVSAWSNRPEHSGKDFKSFVMWVCAGGWETDSHLRPQIKFLDPMPERLILFENVQEEFEKLGIKLKHLNKSKHDSWQKYFEPKTTKLMKTAFREDFELYKRVKSEQR